MHDFLGDAIAFATKAHSGQIRKFGNIPYILHPLEVAAIASGMTSDLHTIIAALLHDTVEDAGVTFTTIQKNFGSRVAELVFSETEDKLAELPPESTWFTRKQESLIALQNTGDIQIKILWLSDKLANLRSFYREYLRQGDHLWSYLHQKDPKMQCWYYETVAEAVSELKDEAAYNEFIDLIRKVFYSSEE